jgi:hypothetical protein
VFKCLPADLDARGVRAGRFSLPMRLHPDEADDAVVCVLEGVWL